MGKVGTIYGLHLGDGVIRYVGQTLQDPAQRMREHRSASGRGLKYPVYCWMRKHGAESVVMVILDKCPPDEINECEVRWIERLGFDSLLNVGKGGYDRGYNVGNKSRTGRKTSEETKAKMRAARLAALARGVTTAGWKHSEETRRRMSESHMGKRHTEETKAKITGRPPKRKVEVET